MRHRVIGFRRIKETRVRGFVSLSALPHDSQQVVQRIECASARPKRILLVVQAYHTRDPLREELGEQLVDNREKCEWPVVRAVTPVTAFGEVDNNAQLDIPDVFACLTASSLQHPPVLVQRVSMLSHN